MSLRPAARASVRSAVGDLFHARFVRDAHELIAEGYSRLDASALGEEEEDVIAPNDGIVIGRSNLPLAHEGDALFHLGYFRELPRAEDIVETFATAHGQDNNPA